MSASFAAAKDCQLFRRDVEGVLTLAAQLFLSSAPGTSTAAAAAPSSSSSLLAGPLIGAVLTEAHTRALLLNTLVRVLVPAPRQAALLHDNRYVQVANEVAKRQQQQAQSNAAGKSSASANASPAAKGDQQPQQQQQQQYRVGRVVGVVPKPGAKPASNASTSAAAAASEAPQRWLLAVYVGECVEPFQLSALSDDAFTEAEHRVFVQSALSTNRDDGSRRAGVLPSQQPALLSAEAAATVQQNIKEVRRVLEVAEAVMLDSTARSAEEKIEACRDALLLRAGGVKRAREADDDSEETRKKDAKTAAASASSVDGESGSITTYLGNGAASQAARLARLTEDVAARGTQLQQLRQLLQQRDQEVKTALQQQHQMEARHRGEADVWRAKAQEQGKAQERAAKEAAIALEQRDRLLEEANTKLRRLAGMATKYKQVVDAVAGLLRRGGSGGEESGKPLSPDEVLAALQHKSLV